MVSQSGSFLPRLSFLAHKGFPSIDILGHKTLRTVEEISDRIVRTDHVRVVFGGVLAIYTFPVGDPMPHFKLHDFLFVTASLGVGKFKYRHQLVGCLLVIIKHKMAADRTYFGGKRNAQAPPGNIHFMDTLITHIPIAVIPVPVPVVMESIFGEGAFWS